VNYRPVRPAVTPRVRRRELLRQTICRPAACQQLNVSVYNFAVLTSVHPIAVGSYSYLSCCPGVRAITGAMLYDYVTMVVERGWMVPISVWSIAELCGGSGGYNLVRLRGSRVKEVLDVSHYRNRDMARTSSYINC
jgi:hypothetical protein